MTSTRWSPSVLLVGIKQVKVDPAREHACHYRPLPFMEIVPPIATAKVNEVGGGDGPPPKIHKYFLDCNN
ncbi:hypothetical protein SprV_0301001100 [Sparganum proliferum]